MLPSIDSGQAVAARANPAQGDSQFAIDPGETDSRLKRMTAPVVKNFPLEVTSPLQGEDDRLGDHEMTRKFQPQALFAILMVAGLLFAACDGGTYEPPTPAPGVEPVRPTPPVQPAAADKWTLWTSGTQLRGANIYQRQVHPELDGSEFLGPGPFGPPYSQADFDRLAALGANYVNISHPGLFPVTPAYTVDEAAVANLDRLLAMIANADMFAVITFRSGPGRSEFSLLRDGAGDWFDPSYLIETVWEEPEARAAWVEMWHYTAERYRDNPIVVGYDLMCEPNSNEIVAEWDPAAFDSNYGGSSYDWNTLYPSIVEAIREVDLTTPILVGGNGYSAAAWLAFLQPTGDPYTVYTFHQYEPYVYTHQEEWDDLPYPGTFDLNYDGVDEVFDRTWLDEFLLPDNLTPDSNPGWPLAVNEYGTVRWTPEGTAFLQDEMELFEQNGWNYAIWQWYPNWPPLAEPDGDHSFNYRLGPDPWNFELLENELLNLLATFWGRNTIRPSTFGQMP
ncbi:MAG: cellulase family glycosylhydrolase [Anaerolineales bacterium]|nr:cellulase family glycosylhydrolase [Anaerolineales bacterium]